MEGDDKDDKDVLDQSPASTPSEPRPVARGASTDEGFGRLLDQHHVVVIDAPLKVFQHPDTASPFNKVCYDECNQEMIVIQGSNVQFSPLFTGKGRTELNTGNADGAGVDLGKSSIRGAKRSLSKTWLAVLKTDREISFYRTGLSNSKPVALYTCKQAFQLGGALPGSFRRHNVVKDFFWLSDAVILILTSSAIETFVVSQNKVLQRRFHVATTIDYYFYHSKHKTLLCVNKEKATLVKTYKVGISSGITRYARLKLDDASAKEHTASRVVPAYTLPGEKMPHYQMMVVRLYGHTCLLHLTVKQEIVVYTLNTAGSANAWVKTTVLSLFEPAMFALNVVDNLILVHNLSSKITMVYDHRLSTKPIAPPMQMGLAVYPGPHSVEVKSYAGGEAYYNPVETRYIHPDKLLDMNGYLFGLMVNLKAIVPTFAVKGSLLNFLLQRKGAKKEVLHHIMETVKKGDVPLSVIGTMFDLINAPMARGIREASTRSKASTSVGAVVSSVSSSSPAGAKKVSSAPPIQQQQPSAPLPVADTAGSPQAPSTLAIEPPTALGTVCSDGEERATEEGDGEREVIEEEDEMVQGSPPLSPSDGTTTAGSPALSSSTASSMRVSTPAVGSPQRATPVSLRSANFGIGDESDAHMVVQCFEPVQVVDNLHYPFYTTSGEWYTTDHVLVVEQADMWRDVFIKLHESKPVPIPAVRFSAIFLEYYRSLSSHRIKLKEVLQRLMIDLLIYTDPPNYPKLHHYLQYHVIEDTVPIALQLLKFEDRYPPSFQLALDMLARLTAYQEIVEVLLARGRLVRAVEIMVQYEVKGVDVQFVLSKAKTCTDPLVLFSLCSLLKKYNSTVRGINGFSEKERCPEFEEQYASVVGVPV